MMNKKSALLRGAGRFLKFCGFSAVFTASLAFAQIPDTQEATSAASPDAAVVEAVLGIMREKTKAAEKISDTCTIESSKTLPSHTAVVAVRKVACVSRWGPSFNKEFLELLYAGKTRFVPAESVFFADEPARLFAALEPAQVTASLESWRLTSLLAKKYELESVMKALDATGKYGVAILQAGIFDASSHTEGTGFEVEVFNPTKKTMKYVTFTVVGLNAVGDPVRDSVRGNSPTLRGIGPIEPGETGSYSKDYMWMTDIVQSFRIQSVKVEYMDGSSRIVSDVNKVRLSKQNYEALMTPDD
jgi:hypothetical protein